jgi:hypothetical protein
MSEEKITELNENIAAAEAAINSLETQLGKENLSAENSKTEPSAKQELDSRINDVELKDIIERRVQEEVTAAKSAFKDKLDEVYKLRDQAVKERVTLEEEKRQAEIKRMEDEGKHKEVAELKMAELNARLESLQKENTKLTRDQAVRDAMRGVDFRSDVAAEMAQERILSQLIQDDSGRWTHKSGISIREYVDHFTKDDENGFLLKAKTNSGFGMSNVAGTADTSTNKPITEMNTEELLQHFSKQSPPSNFGY